MSSTSKVLFRADWCSHKAALHAVTHWHYSGSLPPPPRVCVGAWEDGKFIGCVIFARGATQNLCKPYGLKPTEGCELVRIALRDHATPVSRIVRIALLMMKKRNPGLRLVVSFADPAQGHHGGIYKAGGWVYTGTTPPSKMYRDAKGKVWHARMVSKTGVKRVFGKRRSVITPDQCQAIDMPAKHRYVMPLDDGMKAQVQLISKRYPTCVGSAGSGTLAVQARRGGANPTPTLHSSEGDAIG